MTRRSPLFMDSDKTWALLSSSRKLRSFNRAIRSFRRRAFSTRHRLRKKLACSLRRSTCKVLWKEALFCLKLRMKKRKLRKTYLTIFQKRRRNWKRLNRKMTMKRIIWRILSQRKWKARQQWIRSLVRVKKMNFNPLCWMQLVILRLNHTPKGLNISHHPKNKSWRCLSKLLSHRAPLKIFWFLKTRGMNLNLAIQVEAAVIMVPVTRASHQEQKGNLLQDQPSLSQTRHKKRNRKCSSSKLSDRFKDLPHRIQLLKKQWSSLIHLVNQSQAKTNP